MTGEVEKWIPPEGLKQARKISAEIEKVQQKAYSHMNKATSERAQECAELLRQLDRNSLLCAWKLGNILNEVENNPNNKYTARGFNQVRNSICDEHTRSLLRRFQRMAEWLTFEVVSNLRCTSYSIILELLEIPDLDRRNSVLAMIEQEPYKLAAVRFLVRIINGEALQDISGMTLNSTAFGSLSRVRTAASDSIRILGPRFDQDIVEVIEQLKPTDVPVMLETIKAVLELMADARDKFDNRIEVLGRATRRLQKVADALPEPAPAKPLKPAKRKK